jgi:hypothetical protein
MDITADRFSSVWSLWTESPGISYARAGAILYEPNTAKIGSVGLEGGSMPKTDSLKRPDRRIFLVADLIAQYRDLIEQMELDGRNADAAHSALVSFRRVAWQLSEERQALEAEQTIQPRRVSR